MLGDLSERAQRLRAELQDRLAEISSPKENPPAAANALSTLKTRIVGTFEDAEHKFLHLQDKWNRVDDEVEMRGSNNNRNTDEEEESATVKEEESTAYLGKLLVDFKQNLRERAKTQALRKEEEHLTQPKLVNPHAASKLTVSNISYASGTPNTANSSYYAVFSIESQSQATTRRKPVPHGTVEWTKAIDIEINDVFADLQITLFIAHAQADKAVARGILPLSALFSSSNNSVYELARMSVRKRTKTFILYLLPLKQSTRVLTRSVDGLQIGLQRSATQLGTITVQVTVETAHAFAYTLLSVPPTRELAPAARETEVLDEITLNKRKFRIQRLVPRIVNLLQFHHELITWKTPYITAWFLYLDVVLLFYLELHHLPLFAAVYLISIGHAMRMWFTTERVPLYQDQVAAEHGEVPNTVPKKVKAVADLLTKLQFATGLVATWGEKLVMSWQQDALVALVLASVLLVCGFTVTTLAALLSVFPLVWRTLVFVCIVELHLPAWLVVPRPFAAAAAAAATKRPTPPHMWQVFLQRIPDSRELDHRALAKEYKVEL